MPARLASGDSSPISVARDTLQVIARDVAISGLQLVSLACLHLVMRLERRA